MLTLEDARRITAAAQRKAGPHGPSEKARRRRARVALKNGEG